MQSTATIELQHLLTTPPVGIAPGNNDPSTIAHSALESLRNSGDENFLFLRTILESAHENVSIDETLLFHCITGCRHVILHRWNHYSTSFRIMIRDFFMYFGKHTSSKSNYSRAIQIACYTTTVSFWKRDWHSLIEKDPSISTQQQEVDHPKEQAIIQAIKQNYGQHPPISSIAELFSFLESLLTATNEKSDRSAAILMIGALVGEFAGKSAVSYRLPIEFHKQAHSSFEKKCGLEQSLYLSMGALSAVVSDFQKQINVNTQLPQDILQVILDILNWEYGNDAFTDVSINPSSKSILLRLPQSWKEFLIRPDFVQTIFQWYQHNVITSSSSTTLTHNLGQLLLSLASISGPIIPNRDERKQFATYLLNGTVHLLDTVITPSLMEKSFLSDQKQEKLYPIIVDALGLIARIILNYKLPILVELSNFASLLQGISIIGTTVLQCQVEECKSSKGNIDDMIYYDDREEIIVLLLDCITSLCGDPWLLYSGTIEQRMSAQASLSSTWSSLYSALVQSRTQMTRLEECYLALNEEIDPDLAEVEEQISDTNLNEELISVATLGRLNTTNSISCLTSLFQNTVPQLQQIWKEQPPQQLSSSIVVTPNVAALLEEARLLILYVGHLLTDDCTGETPVIPDAVMMACQQQRSSSNHNPTMNKIGITVESLISFAKSQAEMLSIKPSDPTLSPLLASSFFWFLNRWAPAYILPEHQGGGDNTSVASAWSTEEKAKEVISFCITFCLHFQCCWAHERQVQEGASQLLLSLAKHSQPKTRNIMVSCPSFRQMVLFHCLTAGTRHGISKNEFEATIQSKLSRFCATTKAIFTHDNIDMVIGYQRLPYEERARILTALLVACSNALNDPVANELWKDAVGAVHETFTSLVHALAASQVNPKDIHVKETVCLCIILLTGIVHSYASSGGGINGGFDVSTDSSSNSETTNRIAQFITPLLQNLSGLMAYYADDLTICEALLVFFRDYTEQFVVGLNKHECLALFESSANLLKDYSTNHCNTNQRKQRQQQKRLSTTDNRKISSVEEEQAYSDILCAMDLLIQLGTKDFMDSCNTGSIGGVQVTDMIFYGLQQIIPLMTEGLLQYPTLCSKYFSLVGFMMDTYPSKLCALPPDLFHSIMQSILYGMKHHDSSIAKYSLSGMAALFKEHLQTNCLQHHLQLTQTQQPSSQNSETTILDQCTKQMLHDVIFQNLIWDRLEATGAALLPLVAINTERFSTIVQMDFIQPMKHSEDPSQHHQGIRLHQAFETLLQPDAISKVTREGYEGRANRIRFKKDFEKFCQDVHSFLILK